MRTTAEVDAPAALVAELREMQDRIAIRELTARYNFAVDDVRPEDFAGTYVPDGRYYRDELLSQGREAIAEIVRTAGFGIVHLTCNAIIEIDGDDASQFCYGLIASRSADRAPGSSQWVTTGQYHDTLRRTEEGWRFVERRWRKDAAVVGRPEWMHPDARKPEEDNPDV